MNKIPPGLLGKGDPSQSKIGSVSLDRTRAQAPQPAVAIGSGEVKTFISTYLTSVPVIGEHTPIIYNGDRMWARVTLVLETAGPVAVGQMAELTPVLSGKGMLLQTGVPVTFTIDKGTRLYVAATGINRIKVVVEPVPYLEVITGTLMRMVGLAPKK